jgi:hypothetical protein
MAGMVPADLSSPVIDTTQPEQELPNSPFLLLILPELSIILPPPD